MTRIGPKMQAARVSITTGKRFGAFQDGAVATVTELRISAERAGLICGEQWNCGSVPLYESAAERDEDEDGDMCTILIRVDDRDD